MTNECKISPREFELLKNLMYKETGVFLKPSKINLVLARLRKRLITLMLDSFESYYKILIDPAQKKELECFINSITTNETYFYRNENQFNYLKDVIIPKYNNEKSASGKKNLKIWSAASSTGEEAYTIAMLLKQTILNINAWQIEIYASDINSEVLEAAREGVYPQGKLRKLSKEWTKKYFVSKTDKAGVINYAISPEIKSMVKFFQHNLLKPTATCPLSNFDIIFLSNVLIYFDAESKQKVIDNVTNSLSEGGHLFLGQSESLMGINNNCFKFVMPSSFVKETNINGKSCYSR